MLARRGASTGRRAAFTWSVERETHHKCPLTVYEDPHKIIDHKLISDTLKNATGKGKDAARVRDAARERAFLTGKTPGPQPGNEFVRGLTLDEMAVLLDVDVDDTTLMTELRETAFAVKERIYGNRIVLFAPLYCANWCSNNCAYCAFSAQNISLPRNSLSTDQGHRRILALCGEHPRYSFDQFLEAVVAISEVRTEPAGEIRRTNIEVPMLSVSDLRRLKATNSVGTFTLFQETYHHPTFQRMHLSGPKRNWEGRVLAHDRSMRAGLDDVLFGLFDHRWEAMAMMQHAAHLEKEYGAGPHTISVPRLRPAAGSEISRNPPDPVSDKQFIRLISVLRLAVPYTGMILSTRESASMRDELLRVGVSQMSAGSKTSVGSYHRSADGGKEEIEKEEGGDGQFSLMDERSLRDVVKWLIERGFVPSWCTACYRKGRTGEKFMKIAKAGQIHNYCHPNSLLTLREWLLDYADPELREIGEKMIEKEAATVTGSAATVLKEKLAQIRAGAHDLYI